MKKIKCDNCDGKGKYEYDDNTYLDKQFGSPWPTRQCSKCKGTGWVIEEKVGEV